MDDNRLRLFRRFYGQSMLYRPQTSTMVGRAPDVTESRSRDRTVRSPATCEETAFGVLRTSKLELLVSNLLH